MHKIFRFVRTDEEYIVLKVPASLKGKLAEIIISEKAPDSDTIISADESLQMEQKQNELQLMDKIRNQINFWDM